MTAQELKDWLGKVEELTERYVKNPPEDKAKFQALLRLVDDVERLKKEAGELRGWANRGAMGRKYKRLVEQLRDYTYGGEEKQ